MLFTWFNNKTITPSNLERAKARIEQQWQKLSTKARMSVVVLSLVSLGLLSATGITVFQKHQAYQNFDPYDIHQISPGLNISRSAFGDGEWSKKCQWELSQKPNQELEELIGRCEPHNRVSLFNTGARDLIITFEYPNDRKTITTELVIPPGEKEISVSIGNIVEIRWGE